MIISSKQIIKVLKEVYSTGMEAKKILLLQLYYSIISAMELKIIKLHLVNL